MYELGLSQEYAKQLQQANVNKADVVNYLTQAREYLFSVDSFSLTQGGLLVNSQGEAQGVFTQVKDTLGLSDSDLTQNEY